MAMFDLSDCSAYKNTGKLSPSMTGIGPIDRQKSLFPRNIITNTIRKEEEPNGIPIC
jgi:hypothetical protein